jgi:DNA-binding response OmpR family regulator
VSTDPFKRILLVDDDVDVVEMVAATLVDAGYAPRTFTDSREAWAALEQEYFPFVICDWRMPHLDGLSLCRAMRRRPSESYSYVMLMTGNAGRANYLSAMDAGADDFITKPIDFDLLLARLSVAERMLALHTRLSSLERLLPICMHCKQIRSEGGEWERVESFIHQSTGATMTHTICAACMTRIYGD